MKIGDRSFRYALLCLWYHYQLHHLSLLQPDSGTLQFPISDSFIPSPVTSSSSDSPLCTSITPSLFHSRRKTYMFYKSYPRIFTKFFLPDCLHRLLPGPFLLSYSVFVCSFSLFFVSVPCARSV